MKLYSLENIIRKHGSRTVLKIDSLQLEPHKIYTLIGPNGAGKTSLLNILAFLDQPTGGEIEFVGRRLTFSEKELYECRRQVVLLDQNPIMFTGSVWHNIEFGLKVRKVARSERRRRIEKALEIVSMQHFARYDAQGLSGGETKRVALARALVLEPAVLLCDEPTANVDSENQEIILDIIKRTNARQKMSVVFSTHYLAQGQRLADHTLLLQHGELSDLVNENIFRVTVTRNSPGELICQLTGQLYFTLPAAIMPGGITRGRIHIDPMQIICNPEKFDRSCGTIVDGHVLELRQQSGRVRLLADIGVRLGVYLSMDQYRSEKPGVGDKVRLYIPHQSIEYSSFLDTL